MNETKSITYAGEAKAGVVVVSGGREIAFTAGSTIEVPEADAKSLVASGLWKESNTTTASEPAARKPKSEAKE